MSMLGCSSLRIGRLFLRRVGCLLGRTLLEVLASLLILRWVLSRVSMLVKLMVGLVELMVVLEGVGVRGRTFDGGGLMNS